MSSGWPMGSKRGDMCETLVVTSFEDMTEMKVVGLWKCDVTVKCLYSKNVYTDQAYIKKLYLL